MKIKPLSITLVGTTLLAGVAIALAWTGPISAPYTNNAASPVNVSNTSQTKSGILVTTGLGSSGSFTVSGNTGFGTSSGQYRLEVNGKIMNSAALVAQPNLSGYDIGMGSVGANTIYSYGFICAQNNSGACTGTGGVVLGAANTTANVNITNAGNSFFNAPGGRVGIGTNNPVSELNIRRDGTTLSNDNFITVSNRQTGTATYIIGGILFDAYRDVRDPSNVAGVWAQRISAAGGLASAGDLIFGADTTTGNISADNQLPAERMRITSTGNVGIGTAAPAFPLSVNGIVQSTTGGFRFPDGTTQTTSASGQWTTNVNNIFNSNTGNVGIGNNNPSAKLDVTGTVNISGATTINSTLNVGGATTINNTLNVTGATTLNTLNVTGNTTLNTLSLSGTLTVPNLNFTGRIIDTVALAGNANLASFDIGVGSIGANSIYSYGNICALNSMGDCSGTGGIVMGGPNTAANINISNSGNSFFNTGGNLGVGTNNPLGRLQVVTPNDTTPNTVASWDARHFVVGGSGNAGGVGISYNSSGNYGLINALSPGVAWRNLILQSGGGNVGIGTLSPAWPLSVNGVIHSQAGGFRFPDGTVQTTASIGGGGQWTTSGANIINANSGNVGIGQPNPTTGKLEVAGNVRFSSGAGDTWFPFTNNINYIRGTTYAFGGAWLDENNGTYFIDPSSQSNFNDLRANIFYDQGNTAFYLDPNGTSIFNGLQVAKVNINSGAIGSYGADLSIGNTAKDYNLSGTWATGLNANILLSGLDSSSIAFHDGGSRVDGIRVAGGQFNIGENMGWGTANTRMYGNATVNGALQVLGTSYLDGPTRIAGLGDTWFALGSWNYIRGNTYFSGTLFDENDGNFYIDMNNTSVMRSITIPNNLSVGNLQTLPCIAGVCPPNNAIRMTPNLHLNSQTGFGVILNWDNGTTGTALTFRIGNGAGSDVFNVNAQGATYIRAGINDDFGARMDGNGGWFRTYATTGWFNATYGVGIHAVEAGFVQTYNNAGIKATSFVYYSDSRMKDNVVTLQNSLDKVTQLSGYTFNWKDTGRGDIGLIAQEVEKVFPDLVHTGPDGMKSVEYGNLVAPIIEAIKQLAGNADALAKRVFNTESRLDALEKQNALQQAQIAELQKQVAEMGKK